MKMKKPFLLVLYSYISLSSCKDIATNVNPVNYNVHTFYYSWYGNPEVDGKYNNWNHPILPHWVDSAWNNLGSYPGGEDIGANYFPQIGCYSSNDPEIINLHMEQIREAGIGVVAISWWGKDSFSDQSVRSFLDIAHDHGLKIAFHFSF